MRQTGKPENGSTDDSQVKTETGSLIGSAGARGGKQFAESIHFYGAPGWNRTNDPQLRRLTRSN